MLQKSIWGMQTLPSTVPVLQCEINATDDKEQFDAVIKRVEANDPALIC
jgi:hypothetical protein